jgi:xyloglucan-specific exo-beta-1,4-glucanase
MKLKLLISGVRKVAIIASLSFSSISFAQTSESYNWDSLSIGGGGFVSAVIPSKAEQGVVYARTDVGGAYRWDKVNNRWVSMMDWVSEDQTGLLGVESIAIDPKDASKVYVYAGITYFNNGNTAVLRSSDYGRTFTMTNVTNQFKAHGNGMGRQNGERLQVDPGSSNVLYLGTRWNGLFKSTDSGSSWSRLSSLNVTTTPNENGISFVALDPLSVSGGTAQRILVGVSRFGSVGANLYRSDDGGGTFYAVTGAPSVYIPQRAAFSGDGNIYITYGNGAGPHGHWAQPEPMDAGQIWRYNLSSGTWTNVTPSGYTRAFSGISVDPNNPQRLLASTINTYFQQGDAWGDRIFLSTNGGSSWTDVIQRGFARDAQGITWINGHSIHWAGSIEFDPFDSNAAWVTSGNGIFKTSNVNATTTTWAFHVRGLEETVPLNIVSVPSGPLFTTIGDYDGFRHTDPAQYAPIHTPRMGTTTGLAVASQSTNLVARSGGGDSPALYVSTDGGIIWSRAASMNGTNGQLAFSANGSVLLHSPQDSATTYRSTNLGSGWTTVTGLTQTNARPVADPVNSNKFYAYNNGSMMVSTNGGVSFSAVGSLASGGSNIIRVAPGIEGDIWVPLYGGGLARSTNSGSSFTTFSNVSYCGAVGFGKAAQGTTYPAVYIWGTVNGVRGVHRSTNAGASWVRVNNDNQEFGGPANGQFVMGDMNTYGLVYMSTAGRGVAYGKPSGVTTSSSSSSSRSSSISSSSRSSSVSSSSRSSSVSSSSRSSSISSSSRSSSLSSSSRSSSLSSSSRSSSLSSSSRSSSLSSSSRSSSSAASASKCQYVITNQWNTGFTAAIRITNTGSSSINGWNISWTYTDGTRVTNLWNAVFSGSNPYSASNMNWNGNIQPGQTVEFGFQGTKGSSTQIPTVTGSVCN